MSRITQAVLLAALSSAPLAAQPDPGDPEPGRALTTAFYAGQTDSIWARMTPEMQRALGTPEALAAFRARVEATLGAENTVVEETAEARGGMEIYRRRARFSRFPGLIRVEWVLAADGAIAGFLVAPDQGAAQQEAPSEHLGYRTRTRLVLPVDRPFTVVWGGRTIAQNYHAAVPNQRFAYDLLVVRDGATHTGEGRSNQEYHCFGAPVRSPAEGAVITAVDGMADNVPGQMNTQQVVGNHVIIDHGGGEFSVLAHLRSGSVRVRSGERVRLAQTIGACGNSGNSSEPHLHYQLQNGPEFGASDGLPAQFNDYLADGQPVDRGEPSRGQVIAPRP
jgi:hypothetical protein